MRLFNRGRPDCSPKPSKKEDQEYQNLRTSQEWSAYDHVACRTDETIAMNKLTEFFPDSSIVSDLGTEHQTFHLHFNHFLAETCHHTVMASRAPRVTIGA